MEVMYGSPYRFLFVWRSNPVSYTHLVLNIKLFLIVHKNSERNQIYQQAFGKNAMKDNQNMNCT